MVAAGAQYTATSPHSSPGNVTSLNIFWKLCLITLHLAGGRVSSPGSHCSDGSQGVAGAGQYTYPDYNQYYHTYYSAHRHQPDYHQQLHSDN